jgi:cupin fold WbuC family metalloprotein
VIKTRKESAEVLYPDEAIIVVTSADLAELKVLAVQNPRRRVRLCAHRSPEDRLQEMFIVHTKDCYVRPHMHLGRDESITILEGEVDLILFREDGSLPQAIHLGPLNSGKPFFHRLPQGTFHMLIIHTDFLVFKEAVEGPFVRGNTVFPQWAPAEEGAGSNDFIRRIKDLTRKPGDPHE